MGTMFNQVLALFQGFFSRAFWFGNFLPLVIAAAAHFLVAAVQFPGKVPFEKWLSGSTAENVAFLSISFVSLVVLAYALAPLIPLFRGVFDGRLLWESLSNELRRQRAIEAGRIRDRIAAASYLYNAYDWYSRNQRAWFDRASEQAATPETVADENLIVIAERAVADLREQIGQAKLPPATLAQSAFDAVAKALEKNASQRVEYTRRELENLLGQMPLEAQHQWEALSARFEGRLALDNPQASRIGDARLLTERYSFNAYQVDFDYIWPRLQLVLPEKSSFSDQLIAAKAQIDFAILSLVLILTVPAVWLPWLAFTARSPWLFLAVGAIAPLLSSFFYRAAVEAQFGFGEIVKSAIDRYRFDLLKLLRQPVPATLSAEQALWQQLRQLERPGNSVDLTYRHPTS